MGRRLCSLVFPALLWNMPFADDHSLLFNEHANLQTILNKQINLKTAADAALRPSMAGTFRVKKFVPKHNLANRLHAYTWLLKTYAIPAGMYASQIWATLTCNKAKSWTVPYISDCWQC